MKFFSAIRSSFREAARKTASQRAIDDAHCGLFEEALSRVDRDGADINATGLTSTNAYADYEGNIGYAAIRHGNFKALEMALDRGLNPDLASGYSPPMLNYAILCRREEMAKLLVARGADVTPDAEGADSPLALAHRYGMTALEGMIAERTQETATETEKSITVRKPLRLKR